MEKSKKPAWAPVAPTVEEGRFGQRESHPAFGTIVLTKVNGGSGKFFGTDVRSDSCMRIEIHEATSERSLHRNTVFAGKTLTYVDLTPLQWAEFVSAVGKGAGTPCTIGFRQDIGVVPGILAETEASKFKKEISEDLENLKKMVKELRDTVEASLTTVSKAKKAEIMKPVEAIQMALSSNMPFLEEQFADAVSKVVTEAKFAVAAYAETHGYLQIKNSLDDTFLIEDKT